MTVFDDSAFDNHERVLYCHDEGTGLHAIIAIHSTALGPAAGGCRMWQYETSADALHDVLRLSQGMSYKNAMAGLAFGGGKGVILKTADTVASDALFEKFGEFVDSLNGSYVTAEDVGMSVAIMELIARKTRHVSGLPQKGKNAGGDPSPKTAFGIFCGIEAAARFRLQRNNVKGLRVAVQGVGNVGYHLCRLLHEQGARLVVADISEEKTARVRDEFGADVVGLDDIFSEDVDVFAPCALGAILDARSIAMLKAAVVAGGANNQLASNADGRRLLEAGILYAPDYVINGGGIINVASEYFGSSDDAEVMRQVAAIGPRLTGIFEESEKSGRPTNEIADEMAKRLIRAGKKGHAARSGDRRPG